MKQSSATPLDNKSELSNLDCILQALEATNRLPFKAPATGTPFHSRAENMEDLIVEQHGGGWVANIQFRNVPKGMPDCIGTPNAMPFDTQREAFLAGAAIVCQIATGSPKLPFFLVGDKLIVVAWGSEDT